MGTDGGGAEAVTSHLPPAESNNRPVTLPVPIEQLIIFLPGGGLDAVVR